MGLLLITHDLAVVSDMAQRVALMYAGQIIQVAPADEFSRAPKHSYARALLRALPGGDRRAGRALQLDLDSAACRARLEKLTDQVGLRREALQRYPHEFSGGQRQCIAIARALAVQPQLIICDEPTSALDVSVQAQILNLLRDLQRELGVSHLFITHNTRVVEYVADWVVVMRAGRVEEQGACAEVLQRPQKNYTRQLLAAVPRLRQS